MNEITVKYYFCLRCEKNHYSHFLGKHKVDENKAFLHHKEFAQGKFKLKFALNNKVQD